MFEKSLYDLIRGLRNHRGHEIEYIQNSLKECKIEIKSQDMDKKATALLKLLYMEMFGHDMSWASFHVLEVMSSSKYIQKRVGYLGAVQSFRPDTEVLMLATNLLKKDIVSPSLLNVSLPLMTLPHIITPSLAMSILADLLPRLAHSNPGIRKKAVTCLYRVALVYPEALKSAWPKIKDCLMDDQEDSSVIAAIINVVCELVWRRPEDFLPLAPRFFDLLVHGGNNWMAIKIIKLFATLTQLEPRLVRKLIRPLINIIQTTTAMSLLYECINGIIQGGILDGVHNIQDGEDIARLCVAKLRGMIVIDADPNLKYVALLAFNRIVLSHPALVIMQQDVIMDCLEDADISLRLGALKLVVKMVSHETLQSVINRLINQLQSSPTLIHDPAGGNSFSEVKPSADVDGDNPEERLTPQDRKAHYPLPLPNDYRSEVMHRILDMCSHDNYSNIFDFGWYVSILVQLARLILPSNTNNNGQISQYSNTKNKYESQTDIASRIGAEIRNIAVRVKSARLEATRVAESLILTDNTANPLPRVSTIGVGILGPAAWVAGEFAAYLLAPDLTLNSLIDMANVSLPCRTLSFYLQAIPKLFVSLTTAGQGQHMLERNEISICLERIIRFLEALSTHPDLDVQERAVEFLELMRLVREAVYSTLPGIPQPPVLLSIVIPSLFSGLELNPVALDAQRKIPLPQNLDLDQCMTNRPRTVVAYSHNTWSEIREKRFREFYHASDASSYDPEFDLELYAQQSLLSHGIPGNSIEEVDVTAKRRTERRERNRDDPFYIGSEDVSSGIPAYSQTVTSQSRGDLDIDSIPIMDLAFDNRIIPPPPPTNEEPTRKNGQSHSVKVEITADETFGVGEALTNVPNVDESSRPKRHLLQVDSSGLGRLPLEGDSNSNMNQRPTAIENDDLEIRRAMQEVESFRLGMQRAAERIHAYDVPPEGALIRKKKKKKSTHAKR